MRKIEHPTLGYSRVHGEGYMAAFTVPSPERGDQLTIICSDGTDWEECGLPGPVWEHVSVKATDGRKGWRIPSWREMCFVKDLFWSEDEWVVQFHPAAGEYVNVHDNVLHLWRLKEGFPVPPKECV